jgi:hypothetical protein
MLRGVGMRQQGLVVARRRRRLARHHADGGEHSVAHNGCYQRMEQGYHTRWHLHPTHPHRQAGQKHQPKCHPLDAHHNVAGAGARGDEGSEKAPDVGSCRCGLAWHVLGGLGGRYVGAAALLLQPKMLCCGHALLDVAFQLNRLGFEL